MEIEAGKIKSGEIAASQIGHRPGLSLCRRPLAPERVAFRDVAARRRVLQMRTEAVAFARCFFSLLPQAGGLLLGQYPFNMRGVEAHRPAVARQFLQFPPLASGAEGGRAGRIRFALRLDLREAYTTAFEQLIQL